MDTLHKNVILANIIALCEESSQKVSPSKMCVDLKLSKSLITKLKEDEGRTIKADTAQKIADYFGVSVDRVLGGEQKENPTPGGVELIPNYDKLNDTNRAIVDSMIAQLLAAQLGD